MKRSFALRLAAFALATAGIFLVPGGTANAHPAEPPADATEDSPPAPAEAESAAAGVSPPSAELSGDVDRFALYDMFGNREPRFSRWNPYQQNILKGDLPIFGDRGFLELIAVNFSNNKFRSVVGAGNTPEESDFEKNNLLFGFEIKMDEDAFHPSPIKFRLLGNMQLNNPGVGESFSDVALQEAIVNVRLFEFGGNLNLSFFEGGVRPFKSDLHGLIFNDVAAVGRVFGEFRKNLWRYSVGVIHTLPKDPRSNLISLREDVLLNSPDATAQNIFALVVQRDDLVPGWGAEFSLHANQDRRAADLDVIYGEAAFFGHLGRFIFQPAVFFATGTDDLNPLTGVEEDVSAYAGILDLRYPMDWITWRLGAAYASGDSDPLDGKAEGFDSIKDNLNVFGGPASFFVSEKVLVKDQNSILPSGKVGGRSNFVNPGASLLNVGADFLLTPRVTAAVNLNTISFVDTATVGNVDKSIGYEGVLALRWRPALNENLVVEGGGAYLSPGDGLEALLGDDDALASVFLNVLLVY